MRLTVLFSCDECGLTDEAVKVRMRALDQDVTDWMERVVMPSVAARHTLKSLFCESNVISNLKIPITKDGRVGDPTDLIPPKG